MLRGRLVAKTPDDPVIVARKVEDQRLAVEITAVFMRSRNTYGSPRIYVDLASVGICVWISQFSVETQSY